jgi:hypothetical protein
MVAVTSDKQRLRAELPAQTLLESPDRFDVSQARAVDQLLRDGDESFDRLAIGDAADTANYFGPRSS